MSQELRAQIRSALASAGVAGARDTTTKMRPQWRASYSYRGDVDGELAYVHLYVPSDRDCVQVNCTAPSPDLDEMPEQELRGALATITAGYQPGCAGRERAVEELGVEAERIEAWDAQVVLHHGIEHRMVLAKVTLPLDDLSDSSVGVALRLGLRLARDARHSVTEAWRSGER